ncbi:MAG: hypothetical protein K6L73_08695 [Cellvibrionaceae bacterium]
MLFSSIKPLFCRRAVLWPLLGMLLVGWLSIFVLTWFTPVSLLGAAVFTALVSLIQGGLSVWLLGVVEASYFSDNQPAVLSALSSRSK